MLGFGRRYVTDGLQESPVVEPVYPFQRRELDGFERAPSCSMDEFGLIEAIDRLGESVVVGIADAANGRFDTGFGEAFGIFD